MGNASQRDLITRLNALTQRVYTLLKEKPFRDILKWDFLATDRVIFQGKLKLLIAVDHSQYRRYADCVLIFQTKYSSGYVLYCYFVHINGQIYCL